MKTLLPLLLFALVSCDDGHPIEAVGDATTPDGPAIFAWLIANQAHPVRDTLCAGDATDTQRVRDKLAALLGTERGVPSYHVRVVSASCQVAEFNSAAIWLCSVSSGQEHIGKPSEGIPLASMQFAVTQGTNKFLPEFLKCW